MPEVMFAIAIAIGVIETFILYQEGKSLISSIGILCLIATSVWFGIYFAADWRYTDPVKAEVKIVGGVAVAVYEDEVVNLNARLNRQFEDGDTVTFAKGIPGPYCGVYSTLIPFAITAADGKSDVTYIKY